MNISEQPRVHILTSHPDPKSLTVSIVDRIKDELVASDVTVTAENVATSGFSSAYTLEDMELYREFLGGDYQRQTLDDVRAQQHAVETADVLVIVFPVYWWSMPAQLKAWMDRVLTGGWAWGMARSGASPALANLSVRLVPLVGTEADFFEAEGYRTSMETQIEQGIFTYTHTGRTQWTWLWNAAVRPLESLETATAIAQEIAEEATSSARKRLT